MELDTMILYVWLNRNAAEKLEQLIKDETEVDENVKFNGNLDGVYRILKKFVRDEFKQQEFIKKHIKKHGVSLKILGKKDDR